jgi:hypothetical protein
MGIWVILILISIIPQILCRLYLALVLHFVPIVGSLLDGGMLPLASLGLVTFLYKLGALQCWKKRQ